MDPNGNNLTQAHEQWRDRPDDERYWTVQELHAACLSRREASRQVTVPARALSVTDTMRLQGPRGQAAFTHHSFAALCASVGAPASYLRTLPNGIAAQAVNHGLLNSSDVTDRNLLLYQSTFGLEVRSINSDSYGRVWDADVTRGALALADAGWRAPCGRALSSSKNTRPATEADILPGQINVQAGDAIQASGLYASDHDMFAFLVAPDRLIQGANGHPLMRGVMLKNSEVGDSALVATFFLMQAVCGNHIVWNASNVHEIRVIHRKGRGEHDGARLFRTFARKLAVELRTYSNASAANEERAIQSAQTKILGATKDEVIDAIVNYAKRHSISLPLKRVTEAYEIADKHADWYGSPRSVWGMVSGLTQLSQRTGFADDRHAIDMGAARLMALAGDASGVKSQALTVS